MLDLGATICTSRSPRCEVCPIGKSSCSWGDDQTQPDPARGSAGVSTPQSTFEGSDRQGRGRLIAALTEAAVASQDLAKAMGWPDDVVRAETVAQKLVAEGMVEHKEGCYRLPQ